MVVSLKVVTQWWKQHRVGGVQYSVSSAQEFEDRYGDEVRALLDGNITAYHLCKQLRQRDPPVYVSDGVAKQWLSKQRIGEVTVLNCGHMETRYGDRIRARHGAEVR